MTGPEHLREGKRLLAGLPALTGGTAVTDIQAAATVALAHLTAAQVCAYAAAELPERVSWQEAGDA